LLNGAEEEAMRNTVGPLLAAAGATYLLRTLVRRARCLDLPGTTVLITGGSRGLGLLLAREFGRQGARVAVCARDPAELQRAGADLGARGITALAVPCDVSERGEVRAMVDTVVRELGTIDILVNNAGIIQVGPLETMTADDFEAAMAANFWGAVHTTLAALPVLRAAGRGRIVNIASIGGKISVPHLLPYSSSKFALVGFSEGLRAELARAGILVTTVCPGLMRTGSPRNASFKGRHRAEYAWFAISDSLPGLSIDAERAARRIVDACRAGSPEVILSLPAHVIMRAHGLLPGVTLEALALAGRLLPRAGGIGTRAARGWESESAAAPSWLTRLGDKAARLHNQIPGSPTQDVSRSAVSG
jgi:NAD(P)-dependent dehydrogenase (short-subunit alcohol dehydrogenase family)